MLKNLLTNWKTTSAGLTMIIGSTVHLVFAVHAGTANENTWTVSLTAIVAGIGLLVAGDAAASVTKEEANTTFIRQDGTAAPSGGTTLPQNKPNP